MALTGASTSVVDMSSDTTGLVIAKGTTAERNAISSPQAGMIRNNTETDKVEVYNGADWRNLVEAGNATPPLIVDYLVITGVVTLVRLKGGIGVVKVIVPVPTVVKLSIVSVPTIVSVGAAPVVV